MSLYWGFIRFVDHQLFLNGKKKASANILGWSQVTEKKPRAKSTYWWIMSMILILIIHSSASAYKSSRKPESLTFDKESQPIIIS